MASRILLVLFVAVLVLAVLIGLRRPAGAERLDGLRLAARRRGTVTTVACFAAVIVFVAASPIPARQDVRIATLPALAGLAGSAVLLAVGFATAAPDGRSVATSWEAGAASAGPYPGAVYAVPIGIAGFALIAIAIALASFVLAAQSLLRQGRADWGSLSGPTPVGLPQ